MSLVNIQKAESFPINGVSAYSPKNANSLITFDITGSQSQMLDLGSIRFIYTLRVLDGTGNQRPNNGDVLDALDAESDIRMDARTGVASIWDTITLNDALNNTLEQIRSYGRMMASVMPNTMSFSDYQGFSQMRYGATGREWTQRVMINGDVPQACKIFSGLLQSPPIPFSAIGKLRITLQLANSNFVLYGNDASASSGATYEVRDIKCVYNLVNLDQPATIPKTGTAYKHFSTFNQTIQSSDYQNQYNFNLSNCLSVVNTFIPSTWINNYAQNSLETKKLANSNGSNEVNINNSAILKNNVKFPLDFEVDEKTINDRNTGINGYDVWRAYYYINALKPYYNLNHCLISPQTESLGGVGQTDQPDARNVYGIGVKYDATQEDKGTSFQGGNIYLQRIQSQLDGASPNEIYSYAYSTKRLMPTPQGSVVVN